MTRRNHRVEDAGWFLVNVVAVNVADGLEHLRREQRNTDGWPEREASAGHGSGGGSTTESSAIQGCGFDNDITDLNDAIWGMEIAVKHLARLANEAIGKRAPVETPRCKDGQVGKDAGLWSDDLKCQALPDKAGCCQRHYTQWYRFRVARGVDTSNDFEPSQ